ncbi:MAG: hypothetical protein WCD80_07130 [Desulfobaccales bacterium]
MRLKRKGALVMAMVFFLLPAISHSAEYHQKEALKGLKGVEVVVEDLKPEAEHMGLSTAQIKTDVELRLRKAGIKVLTFAESAFTPGMPYLHVTVTEMNSLSLIVFSLEVDLKERVTLDRGFKVPGKIWSTSSVGAVGINKIREIRVFIGDDVDKFINDYLAANPK